MGFSPEIYTFMTMGRRQKTNTIFMSKLDCANCLNICHKKYSVWALALKAIRL